MFKRLLNEVRVDLTIQPAPPSPLLIKAPREKGAYGPITFVMMNAENGDRPYIPGGSIKGVISTELARLVSRWHPEWSLASDPFQNAAAEWVDRQAVQAVPTEPADIYRIAGPVERCMGYRALKGRWMVDDALVNPESSRIARRPGVAINRSTGASRDTSLFTLEALGRGQFSTTLTIRNYELWQLGLLAHVLARLDGGTVQLGSGKNRGFGHVRLHVNALRFRWYRWRPSDENLQQISVPSMSTLAAHANLEGGYDWRDADLSLTLSLQKDPDIAFGFGRRMDFAPRQQGLDPWAAEPWPAMGSLVGQVIPHWSPDPELVALATSLRKGPVTQEGTA